MLNFKPRNIPFHPFTPTAVLRSCATPHDCCFAEPNTQ